MRIYVHGAPNNGKTKAIVRTAKRPIRMINSPGETGYASIPTDDPEITTWPLFDPTQKSDKILKEVEGAVASSIKDGKFKDGTLVFEGVHNIMDYVMDTITGGAYFDGEKPDWSAFGLCYHWMDMFISKLMVNNVENVIFTGWSKEKGERKARKGEKPDDIPQIIGPNMLGEYSRTIIGRIPLVFHQTLKLVKDSKGNKILDRDGNATYAAAWQTRPYGRVQGVGIKGPDKVIERMPLFIPADYTNLALIWEELSK